MQPKDSVRWDRCCSVRNRRAWSGCIIHPVSNPRAVAAPAEAGCLTGSGATFSTVRAAAVWSRAASIVSDHQVVEWSTVPANRMTNHSTRLATDDRRNRSHPAATPCRSALSARIRM